MKPILNAYPRPKMVRDHWINLNGLWDFKLNETPTYQATFDTCICVPFCVESQQSLVQKRVEPQHFMHYRKFVNLNIDDDACVILHFGAVDQTVDIFINKQHIKRHSGGYASFDVDITPYVIHGNNELYCVVNDKTEASPLSRGKQRLNNTGSMRHIFYTPCSGIWQTVWLEIVPIDHIKDIVFDPDFDTKTVSMCINTQRDAEIRMSIHVDDTLIHTDTIVSNTPHSITFKDIHPWTPDTPNLYKVHLDYKGDCVQTYFAFRKISIVHDAKGTKRFALNNTPIFMSGVLDQGYWPTSLLTPPHDEALLHDIKQMKAAGFNTIRKHVKVECEQFYALCDTMGMLVWQDMPNGGDDYNFGLVSYLPNLSDTLSRHIKDHHYSRFKRSDEMGRQMYYQELTDMVLKLKHYPSIVVWVPFNEGWGQFDATQATHLIKSLDSTRLVNEACGWFDQGGGDIYTIHSYFKPYHAKPKDRVVCLSEFGGQALVIPNHTVSDKKFGYKMLNQETAHESLEKLYHSKVIRNIKHGLSASIYTQLSDVEAEVNGLMTYDRTVFKFDLKRIQAINQIIYDTFDLLMNP
ncbi:hypothetical protein AOC36_03520 [Erysipelothrix larvae]|uniref:Uncharacterized protein n=1 Tax=Erysipelothrix larvae TaxID=1514105 RepID=A0A109UGS9_9FIRM|nr:glycoside hydrolase family 2 [Erysipelothrix larvae]AMC93078.1 hypothetical protein AOC36_03520 [Erysipelothrix larvae]